MAGTVMAAKVAFGEGRARGSAVVLPRLLELLVATSFAPFTLCRQSTGAPRTRELH
jgi:hypothetical protein